MPTAAPSPEAVRDVLRSVVDPELGADIVELGMVGDIDVSPAGEVEVAIALTTAGCPLRAQIRDDAVARVQSLEGVTSVHVGFGELSAEAKRQVMQRARWRAAQQAPQTEVPAGTRVLAVSSGKGGVGKSSVTVNLAVALASQGRTVGLLDADIWGFSVPRMLGVDGKLGGEGGKIDPLEKRVGDGLLKVVSMGFLAGEDEAIMWRGLMLNRALQHFLEDVRWGELDLLLVDMPPGTGDVQMGLGRMLPRAEMLIVTTPALAAQKVAARAADMAKRGFLRVAGVIENMSAFTCDHGTTYPLFGEGGGRRLAADIGAPLLGCIPLEPAIAAGGDAGEPAALCGGAVADAFAALADAVIATEVPPAEMAGCSARLLNTIEAALGPKNP